MSQATWQVANTESKEKNNGWRRLLREKSHARHPPASRLSKVLLYFSILGSPTVSLFPSKASLSSVWQRQHC